MAATGTASPYPIWFETVVVGKDPELDLSGTTFGHYRVDRKIGEGGMGEVYLARDESLERNVALRFLPPSLQDEDTAHARFLGEAKVAAALDHPYLCKIYEAGEREERTYIAMEYFVK